MNSKVIGLLHIVAQILVQGAVLALFPASTQPYLQAIVVVLGIILAYVDPTNTLQKLGMSKAQYIGSIKK